MWNAVQLVLGDHHCDCVPATGGACIFFTDAWTKQQKYNAYSLFSFFYIKWQDALCENRGGAGGCNSFSVNKAKLQECAAAVVANPRCGLEFSSGKKDGWCDCVASGAGLCKFFTDANTKLQPYSVYTLQS